MTPEQTKKLISDAIYAGIAKVIKEMIVWFIVGFLAVQALLYLGGSYDLDSTDGYRRSGMVPHTDNKTGCQYLSVKGGALHPRIAADGSHYGCKKR